MKVKTMALVVDLSALNRCMTIQKCNDCDFFNGIRCKVAEWGDKFISSLYDKNIMDQLNEYCTEDQDHDCCDDCIFLPRYDGEMCNIISLSKHMYKYKKDIAN